MRHALEWVIEGEGAESLTWYCKRRIFLKRETCRKISRA